MVILGFGIKNIAVAISFGRKSDKPGDNNFGRPRPSGISESGQNPHRKVH
jgi:hypothetical protein